MNPKLTPFEAGEAAARMGKPITANPYSSGSIEWTRWRGGYTSAQRQVNEQLLAEAQRSERETLAKAWVQ